MIRQEFEERANRQTARLTLLKKEMASTHHRHLKDYTQHKLTAEKEKEEAALMSMEQYLNKYETGHGEWKRMAYDIFLVNMLIPSLIVHVKHHLEECVYTVEYLARTMYLKHDINLGGINAIRQIEPVQPRRKGRGCRHRNSILWSSSSIKGCMREVEKEMKETVGWKKIRERHEDNIMDGIQYDIEQLLTYLVNAFHLGELAKHETVKMAITVDGEKLDDKVHHMTIGFKICDKRVWDPITGELIFDDNLPDGKEGNIQSAEWCFPVMVILAKDNKGTYDKYFLVIFAFCDKVRNTSINGWNHVCIFETQDMKSTQIVLERGGSAKVQENFCHMCYCTSTNLALQSQVPCQNCSAVGITVCLHHPVCDGDCITNAQRELGTLELNSDIGS
jgi:hypothetical protein